MENWKLRDPNLGTMAPDWPKNGLAVAVQNAFVGLPGSGTGSPVVYCTLLTTFCWQLGWLKRSKASARKLN